MHADQTTEKTGIPRVLEALEANEWTQAPGVGDEDDEDDFGSFEDKSTSPSRKVRDGEFDPESLDFGFDRADFEGLRQAIWTSGQEVATDPSISETATAARAKPGPTGAQDPADDEILDDDEVQKLGNMMRKLQAVRDMSVGLPEEQRKRVAARAVGEVMKEL